MKQMMLLMTIAIFSGRVLALESAVWVQGDMARKMIQQSVKTLQQVKAQKKAFGGLKVEKVFDVYSFDSNWKCYQASNETPSVKIGLLKSLVNEILDDSYCVYKSQQNVGGAMYHPQAIHPRVTDARAVDVVIDQSEFLGETEMHFPSGFHQDVPLMYNRFASRNWTCLRIQNIDDIRPGFAWALGARSLPPSEYCDYASPDTPPELDASLILNSK